MKILAAASLAVFVASPWRPAGPATTAGSPLEAGPVITRTLARGESHRYPLDLAAGVSVRATVQPRGIGVIVTLSPPDGSVLTSVDAARGAVGVPPLVAVAPVGGTYALDVRPLEKEPAPGEYRVAVEERRPAGADEQGLAEAQALFADAQRAQQEGTAASLAAAVEGHRKARERARAAGAPWWELQAAYELCRVEMLLGRNREALDDIGQVLVLSDTLGAERWKGRALNTRGTLQRYIGDTGERASYLEAYRIWARLDDPESESATLHGLANTYLDLGETQQALDHYLRALALARVAGSKAAEARTLHNLGSFYGVVGEDERARDYWEQALALARVAHDRGIEASALQLLAQYYAETGDPQRALEISRESLRVAREAGDRRWEVSALGGVGLAYFRAGEADKAIEHFQLAVDGSRANSDPRQEAEFLRVLGRAYITKGQPDRALDLLKRAGSLTPPTDHLATIRGEYNFALAERARGDLARARQHSEALLALTESVRLSLSEPRLRGAMLAVAQDNYDLHIDLLMQMFRRDGGAPVLAQALETSERSLARTFLESLSESGPETPSTADPALLERDRDLEKRLSSAAERQMRLLAGAHTPPQAEAISAEIGDVIREHDLVETQIHAANPPSTAFLRTQPLTLAEIQSQVLDDRTMLLEYHLGAERSYLWTVTREGMSSHDLPKSAEIEAATRRWHELLSRGPAADGAGELQKQAAALTTMLLSPIAGDLRDRRLLIVASGALQYLPFAALPSPAKPDTPLVVDHEVVSMPSASLVAVLRRQLAKREPGKKTLAVFADPVFGADDERVSPAGHKVPAAAIVRSAPDPPGDVARSAGEVGVRDGSLARLPFTRREAQAILSLVPEGQRMQALDFAASRATATSPELAQYRYVHFATHGFANSLHPELSGIVLSLVDSTGRPQSGFLSASQVFSLKLPAELVVLSGCRTALGKQIRGEGMLGLTRAFMSAGAGRVVASLWKVDDAATADLMRTMYERMLKGGERPAQALRSAQISMLRTRRWSAPYYWAAFVIQGEWN